MALPPPTPPGSTPPPHDAIWLADELKPALPKGTQARASRWHIERVSVQATVELSCPSGGVPPFGSIPRRLLRKVSSLIFRAGAMALQCKSTESMYSAKHKTSTVS